MSAIRILSGLVALGLCVHGLSTSAEAQRRSGGNSGFRSGGGNGGGNSSNFRIGGNSGGGISIGNGQLRINIPGRPPQMGGGVLSNNQPPANTGGKPVQKFIAPVQPGANSPSVNLNAGGFNAFRPSGGPGFAPSGFQPQSSFRSVAPQNFAASGFAPQSFASPNFSSPSLANPPVLPQVQYSQQPIRVQLAANSIMGVNYMLNEWDYSMSPGEKQNFVEDRDWVIRFDRGREMGVAEYLLEPGVYQFVREEATGWQLYQVPATAPSKGPGPAPVLPPEFGDSLIGQ